MELRLSPLRSHVHYSLLCFQFSPPHLLPSSNCTTRRPPVRLLPTAKAAKPDSGAVAPGPQKVNEIRVCVNRTCSKQGSRETLSVLSHIAPSGVSVISCGCLGKCGAGPNIVVLPGEVMVGHCGTAARAAEVLEEFCGGGGKGDGFDPWKNLEALALRKKGESAMVNGGDLSRAVDFLSQAIALKPSGGLHIIYNSRANARLAIGDIRGALEDAEEASAITPNFPQAYICQGDIHMAMEEWHDAEKAYSTALELDPSIRRSKSFKARVAKLQERFAAANASP